MQRVLSRVDYDGETDHCVGFVSPVDHQCLPIVDSYLALSFETIKQMFPTSTVAKYAYVYMAKPFCENVPAFCLACMGTDNKFTAQDVVMRWKHI